MQISRKYIAIPPGETIRELLQEKGIDQTEFAQQMKLSEKQARQLLDGVVPLTAENADQLEKVLGVPAQFWNILESGYRESLVKVRKERLNESK